MKILVVGAGAAGIEASFVASELGSKVFLVDKFEIGGNYINRTCIPSKFLIRFIKGRNIQKALKLAKREIHLYRRNIINELNSKDIVFHKAKFFITNTGFKIKETSIGDVSKIILCNGSEPIVPNIKGKEYLTYSNELLEKIENYNSICIIGSGPEGIEMHEIFSKAKINTFIVEKKDRILSIEDEDISKIYEKILENRNAKIILNNSVIGVKKVGNNFKVILADSSEIKVDCVVSCVGWRPNYEGIEEILKNNRLVVDERLMVNDKIYAAGDVVKVASASIAKIQGNIAAKNALGMNKIYNFENLIPHTIFTSPQISVVGIKENDIKHNKDYKIIKLSNIDLKELYSINNFYLKIILKNDLIVGAACISERADEIINFFSFLISKNVRLSELSSLIPTHPSIYEEILDYLKSK
jgi:Pyruvate/2-oxoglutarate dehydrogenase complex, dihydrolipoamide dehydrogenase (E3) component, and related enzymes